MEKILVEQLASAFAEIPFNKMLGLRLDELSAETALLSFDMQDKLIGNFVHGILHGGVTSSVLDMAGGMVAMGVALNKNSDLPISELKEKIVRTSTVDLQISYVNPGRGKSFKISAALIKTGNHLTFTRMELRNDDDLLIAIGSATYISR